MDSMTWAGAGEGFEWAAAARPISGEVVSGDLHLVAPFPGGVLIAVIDGLGHGKDAAAAARAAHGVLERDPGVPLDDLVTRCHRALTRLRGAVMSLASFDVARATMTWVGVGNVEAVLLPLTPGSGCAPRERLLLWGGIVGQNVPRLRPATLPLRAGDLIVLATDGVHASYVDDLRRSEGVDHIANDVLARHSRGTDDALVLAARYRGAAP